MDTTIGYLHEVREDLLAAAWRADRRGGERGVRRGLGSWSRSRVIAVVVAGALVVDRRRRVARDERKLTARHTSVRGTFPLGRASDAERFTGAPR